MRLCDNAAGYCHSLSLKFFSGSYLTRNFLDGTLSLNFSWMGPNNEITRESPFRRVLPFHPGGYLWRLGVGVGWGLCSAHNTQELCNLRYVCVTSQ